MTSVTLQNWKGTIRYQAARLEKVTDVEQIIRIVKDTEQFPSPVRAKGSHHSTTDCIVNQSGTVIDMMGMNKILCIDRESMTIRMQAGVLHYDAAKALEKMGLQFYVNVEIGNLTVGSGACGGTKDASYFSEHEMEFGQVASYCVGMKVVNAAGTILDITEQDKEQLQAMRSSYGLFGILYEVTFKVKPIEAMQVQHKAYTVDEFSHLLPELIQRRQSMMLYLFPFLDRVAVEYRYQGEGKIRSNSWQWRLRNWVWKTGSPGLARILRALVPNRQWHSSVTNLYNRFTLWVMQQIIRARDTSPADQIIWYPERAGFASYTFSIFAFQIEKYPEALKAYFDFCQNYFEQHGYRCDLLNVGYYIAQDTQSLFSYTRHGDAMTLDPVSTGSEGWEDFLKAYNEFCSDIGGVPLFNQTRHLTGQQVQKAFPDEVPLFKKLREEMDPENRFYSAYFKRIFETSQSTD